MSRIGKKEIFLPETVTAELNGKTLTVKGQLGTLSREIVHDVKVVIEGNKILVQNENSNKDMNKFHGLYRQLINNMVVGVSQGYQKVLTVNGVGYKLTQNGNDVTMNIGFSHPVEVKAVEGITLAIDKNNLIVRGIDKELVGKFASSIKDIKPVEPYHAYGIYYADETVRRKERKTGKK